MKNIFTSILLSIFLFSCHDKVEDLTVNYKNIDLNIPGNQMVTLKYNDKFYAFFDHNTDTLSLQPKFHFYILNNKGQVQNQVEIPKKFKPFSLNLYVSNDSIFTTAFSDTETYYLDEIKQKWIEIIKPRDIYYQDKSYQIFSKDFGEWGGVTWFKNNQTQQQFELGATLPVINFLNNSYYLTLGGKVLEVKNPELLEPSKEPYNYHDAVHNKKYLREGSNSLKGVNTYFSFENYSDYNYYNKNEFVTSFVSNNKLYHVYKDSMYTKIGVINHNNLKPLYTFKSKMTPVIPDYNWRHLIVNNKVQSIQFYNPETNNSGIIEINGNAINVFTFTKSF